MYSLMATALDVVDSISYIFSQASPFLAAPGSGSAGSFVAADGLVRTALCLLLERAAIDSRHGSQLLPVVFPALVGFLADPDTLVVKRALRIAIHLLRPALCAVSHLTGAAASAARFRRARRARRRFFHQHPELADVGQSYGDADGEADGLPFETLVPETEERRCAVEAAERCGEAAPALWQALSATVHRTGALARTHPSEGVRAAALKLLEMVVLALGDPRAGDSAVLHASLAAHRLGGENRAEDVARWRQPAAVRAASAPLSWPQWRRWSATGLDESAEAEGRTGVHDDGGVGSVPGADVPAIGELDDEANDSGGDPGERYVQLAQQGLLPSPLTFSLRDLWASPEGPANAGEGARLAWFAACVIAAAIGAPLQPDAAAALAPYAAPEAVELAATGALATADSICAALTAATRALLARPRYGEVLLPPLLALTRSAPPRLLAMQVARVSKAVHASLGGLKLAPRLPSAFVAPVAAAYSPAEDDRDRRRRAGTQLRHTVDVGDRALEAFQQGLLRRGNVFVAEVVTRMLERPMPKLVPPPPPQARTDALPAHIVPRELLLPPGADAAATAPAPVRVTPLLRRFVAEFPNRAAETRLQVDARRASVPSVAFAMVPAFPALQRLRPRQAVGLARAALTRLLAPRAAAAAARSGATAFRLQLLVRLAVHWLPLGVREAGFASDLRRLPAPAATAPAITAFTSASTSPAAGASARVKRALEPSAAEDGAAVSTEAQKRPRAAADAGADASADANASAAQVPAPDGLVPVGSEWGATLRPLRWGHAHLVRPQLLLDFVCDSYTALSAPAAVAAPGALSAGDCEALALHWLHSLYRHERATPGAVAEPDPVAGAAAPAPTGIATGTAVADVSESVDAPALVTVLGEDAGALAGAVLLPGERATWPAPEGRDAAALVAAADRARAETQTAANVAATEAAAAAAAEKKAAAAAAVAATTTAPLAAMSDADVEPQAPVVADVDPVTMHLSAFASTVASPVPLYDAHLVRLLRHLIFGLRQFDQSAVRALLTGAPAITHGVFSFVAALCASPPPALSFGFVALHALITQRPSARAPALLLLLSLSLAASPALASQQAAAVALLRLVLPAPAVLPRVLSFARARLALVLDPAFPRGVSLPAPSRAVDAELRSRIDYFRRQEGSAVGAAGVAVADAAWAPLGAAASAGTAAAGAAETTAAAGTGAGAGADVGAGTGPSGRVGARSAAGLEEILQLAPPAEDTAEDAAEAALLAAGDADAETRVARSADAFLARVAAVRVARAAEAARCLRVAMVATKAAPGTLALLLRAYADTPHAFVRTEMHRMMRAEGVVPSPALFAALQDSPRAAEPLVLQALDMLSQVSKEEHDAAARASAAAATPEEGLRLQDEALARVRAAVRATLESEGFQRAARALFKRSGNQDVRFLTPLLPVMARDDLRALLPSLAQLPGKLWGTAVERLLGNDAPRLTGAELVQLLHALPLDAARPEQQQVLIGTVLANTARVPPATYTRLLTSLLSGPTAPPMFFYTCGLMAASAVEGGLAPLQLLHYVPLALGKRHALAEPCQVQYLAALLHMLLPDSVPMLLALSRAQLAAVLPLHEDAFRPLIVKEMLALAERGDFRALKLHHETFGLPPPTKEQLRRVRVQRAPYQPHPQAPHYAHSGGYRPFQQGPAFNRGPFH
jgi:hypothetical protein